MDGGIREDALHFPIRRPSSAVANNSDAALQQQGKKRAMWGAQCHNFLSRYHYAPTANTLITSSPSNTAPANLIALAKRLDSFGRGLSDAPLEAPGDGAGSEEDDDTGDGMMDGDGMGGVFRITARP